MAIRTYDNGAFYGVSIGENEISEFRSRFPASGLGGLRNCWAQFDKRNGDLVDIQCNGKECDRFDGYPLSVLMRDMQCMATKKGSKANAPKTHCQNEGEENWWEE